MLHVEQRFPAAFHAPTRWATADGCMPYAICWMYFQAIAMGRAGDALGLAHGIGLAFAGEDGQAVVEKTLRIAFPSER